MNYKKFYPYLLITLMVICMVSIIMSNGVVFGSTTDWVNQHIVIPEYFRDRIYENKSLFLDYAPHLGAGTNIYAFSYYGLFRLDVLIGLLLPFISMKDIVMYSMILNLIIGGCLFYYYLIKLNVNNKVALFSAILLILSSYFFHAHRQIMFVNYMPFLILAMLGWERIQEGKSIFLLTISVFLIITHSYFYSVACILMLLIYFIHRMYYLNISNKKPLFLKGIFSIGLAIGMAAVLLLPTAYYMLSTSKDAGTIDWLQVFGFNNEFKSLMYSAYGCGFTGIVLCLLLASIQNRKLRGYSLLLLFCLISNLICFMLNGTLYVRNKIYLVMNPFILYITAQMLNDIWNNKDKFSYLALIALVVYVCIPDKNVWILLDIPIAIALLYLLSKYKQPLLLAIAMILPILITFQINKTEEYAKIEKSPISEEIVSKITTNNTRYMNFVNVLDNVNVVNNSLYNTSMYSSLSNKEYSRFFYDVMNNPICIQNRVALLNNSNILFQMFMGTQYILTKESKIPIGYETIYKEGKYVIAENKDVMPFIYATSQTLNEDIFNKLSEEEKMEILLKKVIIPKGDKDYQTSVKQEEIPITLKEYENKDIKQKEKKKQKIGLDKNYEGQILIIDFNVNSNDEKEVVIQINDISNKLSRESAAYPNHNQHFTYVVSKNGTFDTLDLELSKGNYKIENIQIHSIPYTEIKTFKNEIEEAKIIKQSDSTWIAEVELDKEGYLVTSLPYEKGFKIFVDGKETRIEKVNTAFIGCKLTKGKHEIEITFEAPYKKIGILISILSVISLLGVIRYEKRKSK